MNDQSKPPGVDSGIALVLDTVEQQTTGSLAARFERLLDLYAPMTDQPDGTVKRDPEHGLISRDDFMRLLDTP